MNPFDTKPLNMCPKCNNKELKQSAIITSFVCKHCGARYTLVKDGDSEKDKKEAMVIAA